MDQQAGVAVPLADLVEDAVERRLAVLEVAEVEPQHEERRRHLARHGDPHPASCSFDIGSRATTIGP